MSSAPAVDDSIRTRGGAVAFASAIAGYVASVAAVPAFVHGNALLVRLPGEIPPLDQIPAGPVGDAARLWLTVALVGFVIALVLMVVGGIAGLIAHRRGDTRGTWAIVMAACWPMLLVLTLGGLRAS